MSEEVLFEELAGHHGSIGLITLNRPKQLNSITQTMSTAILWQLNEWQHKDSIKAVVICGMGEKAFCAGGDLSTAWRFQDTPEKSRDFFIHEYSLYHYIFHFPKPYIAFIQGITFGGGSGLSILGKYRIAAETLRFSMPETGIGFFTDAGASHFLTRCRGKIGWYLGLTGTIINAYDALYAGLVDIVMDVQQFPNLLKALVDILGSEDLNNSIQQIMRSFAIFSEPSTLQQQQSIIDACFSKSSIEKILDALMEQLDEWPQQVYQRLLQRSPLSLKIVLEELNRGAHMDFIDCIRMEYRIANRFLTTPDFYEGIRAAIIDKDRSPHWTVDTLDKVTAEDVARYFEPLGEKEELEIYNERK